MFFNGVMLKTPMPTQHELEMVTLEELVPKDHLLRQIDATVDFEFIRAKVAHLYCADNGRPALDPVVMFKLLFIGYLFGVRSERQLMREVQVNVAYRWFARFRLTDKVPDASTFSQNRRRRFTDTTVYQEIFDEIVRQAIKRGLVDGRVLYTDSTHLKANANKGKFDVVKLEQTPAAYTEALNAAVDADRAAHGRKPLDRDDDEPPSSKDTKISRTDPDSGYMVRDDKPKGFFYLDHRTVDAKHAIITDTHVTPASVHDSQPYLDRLDRQRERFEFKVEAVGLDAGYFTPAVCQGLEERGIAGVMGYRTPNHKPGMFYKRQFKYDAYRNEYVCPQGQALPYSTTNRLGYREYKSNAQICGRCPVRSQCTNSAIAVKVVTRHVWERAKERVDARRLTEWGQRIYARRKQTVERSFADAERFEFKVEAVGLDAGYFTPAVCQGLEERGIAGVMGYRTPNHKPGMFYKRQFKYDAYRNEYVCPQGQALPYSTTNRLGYREYKSNAQICGRCPVRSQCTNSAIAVKVVTRHVWERAKERVDARRLTEWGQRIYARRKQTVERSFADAKQLHGHRYARMRGLRKVAEQCLLAAAAQNIKKIAMLLARKRKKGPAGPDWRFVRMLLRLVSGLRCSFDYPLAANPQS
ncbi:transposase [Burkholderia pseudomallei]|nr:transposase [Burkholderia pseudomallei]